MMGMKGGKKLSKQEIEAKLQVLNELMAEMDGMMKDDMGSAKMKKVTVAAPTSEGLMKGLEKAEEVVDESEDDESCEEGSMMDDAMEDDEDEEELDRKIAELMAKKKKK
jgi:hypothetical protein